MKFTPADNYRDLLVQANALNGLLNSQSQELAHYKDKCKQLSKELANVGYEAIDAERNTNAQLTDDLLMSEQTIARLQKQLSEKTCPRCP